MYNLASFRTMADQSINLQAIRRVCTMTMHLGCWLEKITGSDMIDWPVSLGFPLRH